MTVSFSQCLETGLKWGPARGAISLIFGKGVPVVVTRSLGSCIGLTAGNYIINHAQFCKKWEKRTQVIMVLALAVFATSGVTAGYNYFCNCPIVYSNEMSWHMISEASWSIICFIFNLGITRPEEYELL